MLQQPSAVQCKDVTHAATKLQNVAKLEGIDPKSNGSVVLIVQQQNPQTNSHNPHHPRLQNHLPLQRNDHAVEKAAVSTSKPTHSNATHVIASSTKAALASPAEQYVSNIEQTTHPGTAPTVKSALNPLHQSQTSLRNLTSPAKFKGRSGQACELCSTMQTHCQPRYWS